MAVQTTDKKIHLGVTTEILIHKVSLASTADAALQFLGLQAGS